MSKTENLNKKDWLRVLARKVVLSSYDNDVVVVDEGRVVKLRKGYYGGWLLREGNGPELIRGLWCYKVVKKKASKEDLEKAGEVLERLKKVTEPLGIRTAPRVVVVEYRYRVVTAKRQKATDRYTVYEIDPSNEEAAAAAVRIEFPYKVGKHGRCGNDVCRMYGKLKKLIEAEFRDGEAAGLGVVVPYDTAELEKALAELMGVGEEEAENGAEEAGGAEKAGEAGEAGGGPTRYVVAVLPSGVDEEAAADAVREALRRLGINPIVKVVEAEV